MASIQSAKELHESGFNCAQAVFLAFSDDLGFEKEAAARLTNCLGGGFSQTGGVCGAVSGGCLAVSARFGREDASREGESLERQQKTYRLVQELQETFAREFGAVDCPALLQRGLEECGDERALCPRYILRAAELTEAALSS